MNEFGMQSVTRENIGPASLTSKQLPLKKATTPQKKWILPSLLAAIEL